MEEDPPLPAWWIRSIIFPRSWEEMLKGKKSRGAKKKEKEKKEKKRDLEKAKKVVPGSYPGRERERKKKKYENDADAHLSGIIASYRH